jgi:rod shape-determining protein MreC
MAKKNRVIFIGIVIILTVVFAGKRMLPYAQNAARTITSYTVYPFLKAQYFIMNPIKNLMGRIQRISDLQELVEKLGQEKEGLIAQNVALQSLVQYMNDTQELVDFKERYKGFHCHLAQVILKQFSDQGHYYIVDFGSRHGAVVDMVAVYKNCLVGRVTEVFPLFSKVVLLTDRSCKVAAFCAHTKTNGIYEGMNNEQIAALMHVSHLDSLQKNDLVISSGQGLVFPRGFGLGRIRYFDIDGVSYMVRLSPLLDFEKLAYCYLLQKGEETMTD